MTTLVSSDKIFVYQTNTLGTRIRGNAFHARASYGAKLGVSEGLNGQSYAIPTHDDYDAVLSIRQLRKSIDGLIEFAKSNPDKTLLVTRFSKFTDDDIGPMFAYAPLNMKLPWRYKDYVINNEVDRWWYG